MKKNTRKYGEERLREMWASIVVEEVRFTAKDIVL
jgi:hypothetical protein